MTRALDDLVLAAILTCVGLGSCLGVDDCGDRAQAQDRTSTAAAVLERHQAYVLARVCVSEGGWGDVEACAAYHTALLTKAATVPGLAWERHAVTYTRLFDPRRPPGRLWLLGLDASDARPIGFPAQLPWRRQSPTRPGYLDRWHGEVAAATELVRNPRNPCAGTPTDWASGARAEWYATQHPGTEIVCPGNDRFFREVAR